MQGPCSRVVLERLPADQKNACSLSGPRQFNIIVIAVIQGRFNH